MPTKVKRQEFAVELAENGQLSAEGCEPLQLGETWTPEHLVLGALARCSLGSLRYHARRAAVNASGADTESGAVSARDDGSWGFVELDVDVDVELEPPPAGEELTDLLERAERGCFIGASLTPRPLYRWTVNGEQVAA